MESFYGRLNYIARTCPSQGKQKNGVRKLRLLSILLLSQWNPEPQWNVAKSGEINHFFHAKIRLP